MLIMFNHKSTSGKWAWDYAIKIWFIPSGTTAESFPHIQYTTPGYHINTRLLFGHINPFSLVTQKTTIIKLLQIMQAIHVCSRVFIGSLRSAFSLYRNQLCPLKVLSTYARSIVLHASKKRRFSSVRAPEQWL